MERPKVKSSTVRYEGRAFSVSEDTLELPSGKTSIHGTVVHPGAVVIIPQVDESTFILLRQYRHSIGGILLEFPAGTLSKGEDPLDCAKRELSEETGSGAREWVSLGTLHPAPGFCSEIQHCFLARDLFPQKLEGDEDEFIDLVTMTRSEIEDSIKNGEMTDGKSIAIFAKLSFVL